MTDALTVRLLTDDAVALRKFAEGERFRGTDTVSKFWGRVYTQLCIAEYAD